MEQIVNDCLPVFPAQLALHSDFLEYEPFLNNGVDDLRRLRFGIYAHTRIIRGKAGSLPDGIIAACLRVPVLGTIKGETHPAFARELGELRRIRRVDRYKRSDGSGIVARARSHALRVGVPR